MTSELIPYSLFAENVSESIFSSKAAANEDKHGSPKHWNSDKSGDVFGIKQEQVDWPANRIQSGACESCSTGHIEVLEEDLFLHNRGFMSPGHKGQWKGNENFKGDPLDVGSFGQRGLSRELRDRGVNLKSSFAAVIEWIRDLQLDSAELERAARIESRSKQVDPKYWLAGLSDMEHPNAGSACASGGKPRNVIRENSLLLAEWGMQNSFWHKLEGDQLECQRVSHCEDYMRNANVSGFNDKGNQECQEELSSPWNAVDIMFGFHVPINDINEEVELSVEQGRDFERGWQGRSDAGN